MTVATRPQHMEALDRANEIRLARAQLKRDIKAGRVNPARVLVDPPDYARDMTLGAFLMACRRVDKVGSRKIPRCVGSSRDDLLRELTPLMVDGIVKRLPR